MSIFFQFFLENFFNFFCWSVVCKHLQPRPGLKSPYFFPKALNSFCRISLTGSLGVWHKGLVFFGPCPMFFSPNVAAKTSDTIEGYVKRDYLKVYEYKMELYCF